MSTAEREDARLGSISSQSPDMQPRPETTDERRARNEREVLLSRQRHVICHMHSVGHPVRVIAETLRLEAADVERILQEGPP